MDAAVVLVEGGSDQLAVETLASRHGRDLAHEGITVVPMGGATSIRAYLTRYGAANVRGGLCDVREERGFVRGLEWAGFGSDLSRDDMESFGFYVCDADLEDELIRALGLDAVEQVIAEQRELTAFRTLQKQPAQRERTHEQQLRRFIGTKSGRKVRYGHLLVEAVDLDRVPRPLEGLLRHLETVRDGTC